VSICGQILNAVARVVAICSCRSWLIFEFVIAGQSRTGHKTLASALDCDIYFAHPYHSWERGLNEHTNGLIRQYLPKRTPFDGVSQKQLDKIVEKINNRPRKVLDYRTSNEVFSEHKFALQI
jgi:IS30 family transposase